MTVDEVVRRVAEIAASKDDDEHAHVLEDGLWRDVLRFIASDRGPDAAALAGAALESANVEFSRWYA